MKKGILSMLLSMLILAGCASAPPILPADAKFTLDSFTVNLTQKFQVEGYPVQPEFTQIMKDKFIASLKARNLLAEPGVNNAMSVSLQINYRRVFAGEATPVPSKSAVTPEVSYTLVVSDHGMEKKQIAESGLRRNRGFFGNMKSIVTFGLGRTAKDELEDIEAFADYLANKLSTLKK